MIYTKFNICRSSNSHAV